MEILTQRWIQSEPFFSKIRAFLSIFKNEQGKAPLSPYSCTPGYDFISLFVFLHRFFYKNSFYKNHQAQNCQEIKNILRIMARLKYMIKNLESPIS